MSKSGRKALFVRDLDANAIEIIGHDWFHNLIFLYRAKYIEQNIIRFFDGKNTTFI
jgi:hypothetical protein